MVASRQTWRLKEAYNWKAPYDMDDKYWPTEIPLFRTQAEKIERIMRYLSFQVYGQV